MLLEPNSVPQSFALAAAAGFYFAKKMQREAIVFVVEAALRMDLLACRQLCCLCLAVPHAHDNMKSFPFPRGGCVRWECTPFLFFQNTG
jgi:hypothetical protein